jgi:hypothetical protein
MSDENAEFPARVAFRAMQQTIETELKEGYSARSIYERHKADLAEMSYRQFSRYVRKIGEPPDTATALRAHPGRALTHREFAQHASLLAAYVTTWLADSIAEVEAMEKPMSAQAVALFVGRIRETLNSMEAKAR